MRLLLLSSFFAIVAVACSGSDDAVVPASDTTPTSATSPSSSASAPSSPAPPSKPNEAKDAGADGPSSKDAGPEKEPGCDEACAKAYACKMVSSPKSCVCGGKAGSVECVKCWLSHTCDELKSYACYGACN